MASLNFYMKKNLSKIFLILIQKNLKTILIKNQEKIHQDMEKKRPQYFIDIKKKSEFKWKNYN